MNTRTLSPTAVPGSTAAQDTMALIGRILIALLFVPAGFSKIAGFSGTVGYIASKGLPLPEVGAAIAIVIELGIGLMFLFGWRTRLASIALAIFTLAASVFFHNFWAVAADQVMSQQQSFFKNLATVGGLLAFAAFGGGRFSLDARTGRA